MKEGLFHITVAIAKKCVASDSYCVVLISRAGSGAQSYSRTRGITEWIPYRASSAICTVVSGAGHCNEAGAYHVRSGHRDVTRHADVQLELIRDWIAFQTDRTSTRV